MLHSSEAPTTQANSVGTEPAMNVLQALTGSVYSAMVVHISMPAFNVAEHINFKLLPQSYLKVIDGLEDLVDRLSSELTPDLMLVDKESTEFRMDQLRKRAVAELSEWHTRSQSLEKVVNEWKSKVNHATALMNKMRDAYYRELFHLREQVYQKKVKEKKNPDARFQPTYAIHFDPSEYTIDDEVARLVKDKLSFMRQEFETKHAAMDANYQSRLHALTEAMKSSKMLLSRKEMLCKKLMDELGCKDEENLEETLRKKALEKENAGKCHAPKSLREFIDGTYGSFSKSREALDQAWDSRESLGPQEFESFLQAIGYALEEPQKVFLDLAGGSPLLTRGQFFKCMDPEAEVVVLAPKEVQEKTSDHPRVTFGADNTSFDPLKFDDLEDFGKNSEDDAGLSDGSNNSKSSKESHSRSVASKTSACRRSNASGSAKSLRRSSTGAITRSATTVFSRRRSAEGTVSGRSLGEQQKAEVTTMTSVSYGCGIEEAFSIVPAIAVSRGAKETVDVGITCKAYKDAFPKVQRVTRACQSEINREMLLKAKDYFDQEAESLWNQLAGMPADSESDDETSKAEGGTGGTIDAREETKEADKGGGHRRKTLRRSQTFDMVERFDFSKPCHDPETFFKKESNVFGACKSVQVQAGCAPVCESSIQCNIKDACISEHWLPREEDPFESQLQQILDLGSEIETRLPDLRLWAEKLVTIFAGYAMSGSEQDRKTIEQLNYLRSSAFFSREVEKPTKGLVAQIMERPYMSSEKGSNSGQSVADLLKRHGVGAEADSKEYLNDPGMIPLSPKGSRHDSVERQSHAPNKRQPPVRLLNKARASSAETLGDHCPSRQGLSRGPSVARRTGDDVGFDSDSSDGDFSALISKRSEKQTKNNLTSKKPVVDVGQLIVEKARRRSQECEKPSLDHSFFGAEVQAEANPLGLFSGNPKPPGWSGLMGESSFEKRLVQIEVDDLKDASPDDTPRSKKNTKAAPQRKFLKTMFGPPATVDSMDLEVGRPSAAMTDNEITLEQDITLEPNRTSASTATPLSKYNSSASQSRYNSNYSNASQEDICEKDVIGLLNLIEKTSTPPVEALSHADASAEASNAPVYFKRLPRVLNTPRVETPSRQKHRVDTPRQTSDTPHHAVLSLPEDVGCSLRVNTSIVPQKPQDKKTKPFRIVDNNSQRPKTSDKGTFGSLSGDTVERVSWGSSQRPRTTDRTTGRNTFGNTSGDAVGRCSWGLKGERKTFDSSENRSGSMDQIDMLQDLEAEVPARSSTSHSRRIAPVRKLRKAA